MNIKSYLPSKKIIIAISIIIILVIVYLLYAFVFVKKNSEEGKNFIDVSLIDQKNEDSFYYLDSDNDGAYDWEEALWPELDPNNPDSDGDGVLDGKYIKNKQAIQERERRGMKSFESNLTETQKLGRSTFIALMAVMQSGGTLDDTTQAQLSENIASYIGELTLGDILYTRDKFILIENSQENIYKYRDFMKNLFQEYPVATSDIELLINATENIEKSIDKISVASAKYDNYLSELTTVEIPYAIAGRHTELVNGISQLRSAFNNLLLDEPDELILLSAIIQIETIMNQVAESIININDFFEIIENPDIFKTPYNQ